MRTQIQILGASLAALVVVCASAQDTGDDSTPQQAETTEPKEIGLVEKARRGLVQLDVTVRGKKADMAPLTADEFELVINTNPISNLIVDRLCRDPAPVEPAAVEEISQSTDEPAEDAPVRVARPISYLFYFDQHHLTMSGRVNALDNARLMMPDLVKDGNRATIVSSGQVLDTIVEMTDDTEALLEGLDRLDQDRKQWDPYPEQETLRIREVIEKLEDVGQTAACSLARFYQQDESFRTDKEMRTLSIVLGLLADVDPPKAVLYFADTMRKASGQHYFTYAGCRGLGNASGPSSFGSEHAIDRAIHEASANGIRLYTVEAQGLTSGESIVVPAGHSQVNSSRLRAAQDSLAALALETGGQAFLNGTPAKKMVQAIQEDLSCLYLVSFDPGDLPLDAPLRVLLRTTRPKVKLQVRGQLVLQSESKRQTSRLLSAFATPGSVNADAQVEGVVVPTGFEDGRYTALVQLTTSGSPLPESRWDIGASLVSRGEVKEETAGQISIKQPGVRPVLEAEMEFRPGPFDLIVVAHDTVADQLGTVRVSGVWPEKGEGPAVGPIAVLQPANGVFLRDGAVRETGSLGRSEDSLLRTDLPTAMIGLVCRGNVKRKRIRIERSLVGEGTTEFPTIQFEDKDLCTQVRDVIPTRTMTPGTFSYEIRVLAGDVEMASGVREFSVIDDGIDGG